MMKNIDDKEGLKIKPKTTQDHEHSVMEPSTNRNPTQSLLQNAITLFGPCLYTSALKYLRSGKMEKFKFDVNKCLELIPDEPALYQPTLLRQEASASLISYLIVC